jgi:hypothetical protein
MRCLLPVLFVLHFAVGELVADSSVEIDAFGKGRAESVRYFLRHVGINIAAAGRELDPEL